jgi:hypothetical protein
MPTAKNPTTKPISSMSYQEIEHELAIAQYQVDAAFTHSDAKHEKHWDARIERLLARRRQLEAPEED